MIEKKNIDRLFQEKFKDFEAVPGDEVWENIEARLTKKKKRRAIPLWLSLSGAAALFVSMLLIGDQYFNDTRNNEGIVIDDRIQDDADPSEIDNQTVPIPTEKTEIVESAAAGQKNSAIEEDSRFNKRGLSPKADGRTGISVSETPKERSSRNTIGHSINPPEERSGNQNERIAIRDNVGKPQSAELPPKQTPIEANDEERHRLVNRSEESIAASAENQSVIVKKENNINRSLPDSSSMAINTEIADNIQKIDTVKPAVPNALEELLKEKENAVAVDEQKINRWRVSSNVAPIYFSSASKGSPLDPKFESNNKAYKPTIAYGVGVQYAVNDRVSLRSGINAVTLEYNTTDVTFFQTTNARLLANVDHNARGSMVQIENKPTGPLANMNRTVTQFGASLSQSTGYIEVPLELSYKVIDKKFDIDIIGGVSTLFLNKNDVSILSEGLDMNIGEANNLNNIHFSTNIGLGLKYNFLRSFEATLEPLFKYQINTFSDDGGNFKPFFFGLYTGLNYRF